MIIEELGDPYCSAGFESPVSSEEGVTLSKAKHIAGENLILPLS